jgi:PAS domain S-box-containing protein
MRCRLCARITLMVFAAILAVEAAIMIPSYRNYQHDLLKRLSEVGLATVSSVYRLGNHLGNETLLLMANSVTATSKLKGGRVYDPDGQVLGTFGELPDKKWWSGWTPPSKPLLETVGARYDFVWLPEESGLPVVIVGRMDSLSLAGELNAFLWRIGALVLLISAVVCAATLYILGRSVLVPVLKIRDSIGRAVDDPANAAKLAFDYQRNDEIGDLAKSANRLLNRVSQVYREELATLVAMVDDSLIGTFAYDRDGSIVYANRKCMRLCGVKRREELQELELPRFSINNEQLPIHLKHLIASEGSYTGEVTLLGKNGKAVPCLLTAAKIVDDRGNLIRFYGTMMDISELHDARQNLERQNLQLAASSRAKSEFLANMSHELRTPLNAIIGFSEIIRDNLLGDPSDFRYNEYARDIHDSGTHLLQVINDILDLAKIEAGKLELVEEKVDVRPMIESVVRLIDGRAASHSITIEADLESLDFRIWADARKLKQILINLLSNAVKFTPDGGKIAIAADRSDPDTVTISVLDSGIGIAEDDIAKVLSPFGQVDGGLGRKYEGTGLGLPLTQAMVELHDGRLELESIVGQGTTVRILLPESRILPARADDEDTPARRRRATA